MDDEKNEITDKVKNKDKNKSKLENKIKKNIKRTIFLIAKIFIPIFLFIFLIVGIWYVIESLISIEVSTGTAGELADSTSISEDGAITVEDTVYEDIRKLLKDKGIDPEVFWLGENNYVEGTDTTYLEKMVAAEIASSYPDTGVGDIRGIVKIQRNNENLTYKSQADFQSLLDGAQSNGNIDDVKKYFTLDEELNIKVATSSKTTTKATDGTETTTYTASPASLNYKNLISQYTMPFEFLFALMQSTENPEYVAKVADLALEESEIILNIYDTETTIETTTETTWDNVLYSGETRNTTRYNYSVPLSFESRTARGPETSEETTVSNSVSLKVTSVKTWIYSKTATYTQNTVSDTSESEPTVEDTITGSVNTTTSKDGDDYVVNKSRTDIENRTTTATTTATSTTWQETGESTEEIDVNRFLGLWKNETGEYVQGELYKADGQVVYYHVPRENVQRSPAKFITKYPELLFSFLSNSQDTQGIERIMRYILYVYTGKDYGVTEIDDALLSLFKTKKCSSVNSLREYLHQFGGSEVSSVEKDGVQFYEMYTDNPAGGNPTIGYGDIKYSANYDEFRASGKVYDKSNGLMEVDNVETYITSKLGEYNATKTESEMKNLAIFIEKEFVDNISNQLVQRFYDIVERDTAGFELSRQQMYALTYLAYARGQASTEYKSFKPTYEKALSKYEKDSYEFNMYIWDNCWYCAIQEGNPGQLKGNDSAFETYVKGTYDFGGPVYNKTTLEYYTKEQITEYGVSYNTNRQSTNEEEIFTYVKGAGGGAILDSAQIIHDYMSDSSHLYYYCLCGSERARSEHINSGIRNCGLNSNFETSKLPGSYGYRLTCCATYVSWVLEDAGLITTHYNSTAIRNELLQLRLDKNNKLF